MVPGIHLERGYQELGNCLVRTLARVAQCPAKYLMFVFVGAKDQTLNEQVILPLGILWKQQSHLERYCFSLSTNKLVKCWWLIDISVMRWDGIYFGHWCHTVANCGWHCSLSQYKVTDIFCLLFVWYFSNLWFEWISGGQLSLGWGLQQGRSITILIGLCYRC